MHMRVWGCSLHQGPAPSPISDKRALFYVYLSFTCSAHEQVLGGAFGGILAYLLSVKEKEPSVAVSQNFASPQLPLVTSPRALTLTPTFAFATYCTPAVSQPKGRHSTPDPRCRRRPRSPPMLCNDHRLQSPRWSPATAQRRPR